jgi:signal transduction histidine kinase
MTLARAGLIRSLLLALVGAIVIFVVIEWLRARDRDVALTRVAQSFQTDLTRQSCESDPLWFLAGPRVGRPRMEDRQLPDADVRLPRPSTEELPFEVFAYDDQFAAGSSAGPRFPEDFKRAMRSTQPAKLMIGSYSGRAGTGRQIAIATGWTPGPCSYLLFRSQALPGQTLTGVATFAGVFAVCLAVALGATWPTIVRIRGLSAAARLSARENYSGLTPIKGSDEIASLGSIFNDTAADIRRRIVDAQDREEALRRYVASTTEGVSVPLMALEQRLADLERAGGLPAVAQSEVRTSLIDAHRLSSRLLNLSAVTDLRGVAAGSPREAVDLRTVVESVVASRERIARAAGVTLDLAPPDGTARLAADAALITRAFANLVDNAILYNRPGGRVHIELRGYERDQKFSLRVVDNGPGVTDDEFAGLTANKRFRGDEATNRRPGARGLGLALTREIADRFGLQLDLRRPTAGGFEAELSTRSKS